MNPERWAIVEKLCQDALDRVPADRAAFLDQACGADPALRSEVESLLAFESPAESFIESPPDDVAAGVVARESLVSDEAAGTVVALNARSTNDLHGSRPRSRLSGKPLFFWIALGFGMWIAAMYLLGLNGIYRFGALDRDLGWRSAVQNGRRVITTVDPNGIAAGKLQTGDQVVSFNDDSRYDVVSPAQLLSAYPWGTSYTVRVQRNGQVQPVDLSFKPVRDPSYVLHLVILWVIGIVFVSVGLVIGLAKPSEKVPRLASLTMLAAAILFLRATGTPTGYDEFFPAWARYLWVPIVGFRGLHLALAYHFYYRLPAEGRPNRFWSVLKYLLYGCFSLLTIAGIYIALSKTPGAEALLSAQFHLQRLEDLSTRVLYFVQLAAFVAICAVVIRGYWLTKPGGERQRVKLLLAGSLAALIPSAAVAAYFNFVPASRSRDTLSLLANLLTVLIPITAAYAILKHRFLDIRLVVRRGLQYALAKTTLWVLLALPVIWLLFGMVANPDRTLSEILFGRPLNPVLIVLATLGLLFRKQLSSWIDRLFFREVYDREQILLGVIEEIKELQSREEIARHVCRQIETALHPECVYIFYRNEDVSDLSLGYSSNRFSREMRVPDTSSLVRALDGQTGAQDYPLADQTVLTTEERSWLEALQIELIVPLAGSESRLRGFLLLGEKKSEQPYTATDKRMLSAIAQQMAVVSEISWLKERVDRGERIKRDVLLHVGENLQLMKECPNCGACYDAPAETCAVDGAGLTITLPVERTLADRYRLDQLLGKGGMGSVYRATDLKLDRAVAIKLMIGNVFGDKSALRRFAREAQATARLNHPNIVSVYDYGTVGTDGAYLVMELIPGSTLKAEIKRRCAIPTPLLGEWFAQILAGMNAAHTAGITHRDLKPDNILITEAAGLTQVKILDFGLAKFRWLNAADPNSLTEPGMVMGTLGYMAPEQLTGEETDARSDVFSLGVMLIEAMTGKRPFNGKNYHELAAAVLNKPYHLDGDTKPIRDLDAVLQKCIAKDRKQRFDSVAEMQREMLPALTAYRADQ